MAKHILKCWPNSFRAIARGEKRADYRKDDRGFEVGDVLVLQMWEPVADRYPSRADYVWQAYNPPPTGSLVGSGVPLHQEVQVTYIQRGMFGIPDGYCVLSFEVTVPSVLAKYAPTAEKP